MFIKAIKTAIQSFETVKKKKRFAKARQYFIGKL
jgi:hypothetical protein